MIIGKVVHGKEQNNALKLHGKIKDSFHVLSMFLHKIIIHKLKQ